MSKKPAADELRDEYGFTPEQMRAGIRGKYAGRHARGVNMVRLDPDVAAVFPDSESVNKALRPSPRSCEIASGDRPEVR